MKFWLLQVADCLAKLPAAIPHGLTSFLKFAPTIKRESENESSPIATHSPEGMSNDLVVSSEDPLAQDHSSDMTIATDGTQVMADGMKKANKVKKKYKKKNPKPKKTRPGQVWSMHSSLELKPVLFNVFNTKLCFVVGRSL